MNERDEPLEPEATLDWSVRLNEVPAHGLRGERHADEQELRHLTGLLDGTEGLEVRALHCHYELVPGEIEGYPGLPGISGRFHVEAALKQTCVVTLESIDTSVIEDFEQNFVEDLREDLLAAEVDHDDPFAAEAPLDIAHGRILFGPLVYEYFAMAIDPNPRKPGVEFETASSDDGKLPSPFAVLKKLKGSE